MGNIDKAAKWGLTAPVPLEKMSHSYTKETANANERSFVDGLGKHSGLKTLTRVELLLRYRAALDKRTAWGFIDPIRIKEHTNKAIALASVR